MRIGNWIVDVSANTVTDGAEIRKLELRAMRVLVQLAEHAGEVVSKEALIDAVWNGHAVSDHSVAVVVSDLRRALGDDRREPRFIETVPKRGYRLIAPVERTSARRPAYSAAIAVGFGALLFAFIAMALTRTTEPSSLLVVRDVRNATGREDLSYVAHAVSETLTVRLVEGDGASAEILRFRDGNLDEASAQSLLDEMLDAHQTRTGHLVSGRLVLDGGAPLLTLELSEKDSGSITWARSYRIPELGVAALSRDIAHDVATALSIEPSPATAPAATSAEVLELYWRARYLWSLRQAGPSAEAIRLLEHAIALDGDHAPVHSAIADIYAHKSAEELELPRVDTFARAREHLTRASALAPESSEVLVTEAFLLFYAERDAESAALRLERAIEADPRNALAWQSKAMVASALGRHEASLDAIARARDLDPLSASILWDEVWFLYLAGRPEEALSKARDAERVSPPVSVYYALIYEELGQYGAALRAWADRMHERGLGDDNFERAVAIVEGASGEIERTYQALVELAESDARYVEPDVPRAILLARAGRHDEALELLETIDPARPSWWSLWLDEIPALAELRGLVSS